MSKSSKGRAFVYSTNSNKPSVDTNQQRRKRKRSPGSAAICTDKAGGSVVTGPNSGSHGLPSKVQKVSIAEFDDDEFDEVGAAALDEYVQTQQSVPPINTIDTPTSTDITIPTTTRQCYSYQRDQTTNPSAQSDSIQQAMDQLREDNFTKDGEVKVLRSEKDRLLSELRKREEQMRGIQSKLTTEKKNVETQLSREKDSLTAKLQFQEQEIVSLREKCLLLEQHKKSPGTSKPIPTSRPIKTAISSKTSSTTFLSTESFMPRSQCAEVTSVHVKPKRANRERSVSLSDKKPEVAKSKKVRVSRSPTTTPSNSLSGKMGSKNTKNTSPCNKPPVSVGVDPSMILSVQGRELDDPQLLMLLIRRDLLKPPVFLSTNEQEEAEPSPVVMSDKDSQSSDEESSQSSSEDSQNSITGLLSLLRVQPKPKTFSGYSASFVTPIKALDSSLVSTSESSPSACTPVRQKRMQPLKPHTLARMDLARPRMEKPGSSLLQSLSANNTPIHCAYDERTSSLFSSIDKKGLEVSIGALLQSADLSSISRATTLCATSFCPNKLHSRMLENSNLHLLIRNITATVLQYHTDQSTKARGTANTSISDGGDTADSSMSLGSHKSISSSGSSKASSELFSPLKCDQQLVSKFLEILYTLVSYYQSVREQILYQPSKLILDSRPRSSVNLHAPSSTGSLLDREGVVTTLKPVPPDLAEVSRRLSFKRDRSCTPDSPTKAENDDQPQTAEVKQWKKQQLCNISHHSCNLSSCVWTQKKITPQDTRVLDQSFSVPASRVRVSDGGGLFNVLLEMPAPPWRESKKNVVTSLKILSTLAEHCSVDSLQQFSPLLEDDVLGPCLDKDDPAIVRATLSLLTHLVRSPIIVGLLCSCSPPSPCVPVNCYDICLQTMPDDAHRQSGYTNQLQVVRLISTALVADNGVAVLLTSPCQCTHELLKTFVSLLSNLLDNVQDTSQWTRQELTVVLEVISLLHKISIHDNYFDSHLYECDHTYNSVMSSLQWLLATHPTPLREVAMVTDLLECAEELDDSEEVDKMDIPN